MITLMVITDGRGEYLEQALASWNAKVQGDVAYRIMVDDSADKKYAKWLDQTFPDFFIVHHKKRLGFGGAIQSGWDNIPSNSEYIFHLEEDFVFTQDLNLGALQFILETHPHLAQISLKRQPWSMDEKAVGGFIEKNPDAYTECEMVGDFRWMEQKIFFTTNPSLYPRGVALCGWPQEDQSEGKFSIKLRNLGKSFGIMGWKKDAPRVEHIGYKRTGTGY